MAAELNYRFASVEDAPLLAAMNQQLIRDEGHRNPMTLTQLEERMRGFLTGEYRAVLFLQSAEPTGYALFRSESELVYLRQFFVVATHRRQGIGRAAIEWLCLHAWADSPRVRLDVLIGNADGLAFWRAVGFIDYCLTLELPVRPAL